MKRRNTKSWYAAHVIMYYKLRRRRQRQFEAFENIFLIHASSQEEARKKAEAHGRFEASVDDGTTVNTIPAKCMFGGVRKVVSCAGDPQQNKPDTVIRIYDGVEATYSRFVVNGRDRLRRLAQGKMVAVVYEE